MKFYLGPYEKLGIPGADIRVTRNALKHCVQMSYSVFHTIKKKLATQAFKFTYTPTGNAAFNVPVFKKTAVTKHIFVDICYFDFHSSEVKNVEKWQTFYFSPQGKYCVYCANLHKLAFASLHLRRQTASNFMKIRKTV